jgi:cyclopropane-fatty-acyl-phospholipid synthase
MKVERSRRLMQGLLERADVAVDGDRPWDIRVLDPRMFARVLAGGSLALGDSYVDGWWECDALDRFFDRVLRAGLERATSTFFPSLLSAAAGRLFNPQRPSRAFEIGGCILNFLNPFKSVAMSPVGAAFQPRRSSLKASPTKDNLT